MVKVLSVLQYVCVMGTLDCWFNIKSSPSDLMLATMVLPSLWLGAIVHMSIRGEKAMATALLPFSDKSIWAPLLFLCLQKIYIVWCGRYVRLVLLFNKQIMASDLDLFDCSDMKQPNEFSWGLVCVFECEALSPPVEWETVCAKPEGNQLTVW